MGNRKPLPGRDRSRTPQAGGRRVRERSARPCCGATPSSIRTDARPLTGEPRPVRAGVDPVTAAQRTVAHYLVEIAELGGYLARAKDPPPGNLVIWRGLVRLADILSG